MKPAFVDIHYSRVFPVPMESAFAWLTDYQDSDPSLTTTVVKRRPVISREKDLVVLEGELELVGARGTGKVEVRLFPPDRYVATIVEGSGRGSVYEYALVPVAGGTRLDVRYRVLTRRWKSRAKVWLAKPVVKREIHTMWEGFASAMAKDLGPRTA